MQLLPDNTTQQRLFLRLFVFGKRVLKTFIYLFICAERNISLTLKA
jgi:hypothetical protein